MADKKFRYRTGIYDRIRNKGYPLNFFISNRSVGKSYQGKKMLIDEHIKTGRQFLYLRRTLTDCETAGPIFFEDVGNEYERYTMDFENGKIKQFILKEHGILGDVVKEGVCGFATGLSYSAKIKSWPLENVFTMFYDEFLPDDLRYLHPNDPLYEPTQLQSIMGTVIRKHGTLVKEEFQAICAANNVTDFNPYFSQWQIDLTTKSRGVFNGCYAEKLIDENVNQEILKTKFGRLIQGTKYGDYALNNVSMHDTYTNIAKHPKNAIPYMSLYFHSWYTIWVDRQGKLYIGKSYDETFKNKFKLNDIDDNVPWFVGEPVKIMRDMTAVNKVYYEDMSIKTVLAGLFMPKIDARRIA